MSDDDMEASLIEEFVLESTQNLRSIEQDVLRLEDASDDPEVINNIFRAIHSMKGTSGYLALDNIQSVSHLGETLLDQIRKREREATAEAIDVLLDAIDILREMVESEDLGASRDVATILASLNAVVSEGVVDPYAEMGDVPPMDLATAFNALPEHDALIAEMERFAAEGRYLFLVRLRSEVVEGNDSFANGLRPTLDTVGITIASSDEASLDAGQVDTEMILLFSSVLEEDMLAMSFEIHPNDVLSISVADVKKVCEESAAPAVNEVVQAPPPPPPKPTPKKAPPAKQAAPKKKAPVAEKENKSKKATPPADGGQMMKVQARFLDELLRLTGNMVMARNQMLTRYDFQDDPAFATLSQAIGEVHRSIVQTRMETVASLFDRFRRVVRDLGRMLNKRVDLRTKGGEIELDRTILESFTDPMTHMIRNCMDHAIEPEAERAAANKPTTGTVHLRAYHESGEIVIEVEDDGRGIDGEIMKSKAVEKGVLTQEQADRLSPREAIHLIFHPGFSTADEVSDVSGRGVGMDVVRTNIEKIGGVIDLQSTVGQGTIFSARLPLTQALVSSSLISSLIVRLGDERFAIPETAVNELIRVAKRERASKVKTLQGQEVFQHREVVLPVVRLEEALDLPPNSGSRETGSQVLIVLQFRHNLFGIMVDEIIGVEEIVVRESPVLVKNSTVFSGHTVLGDGQVVMIIDINGVVERMHMRFTEPQQKADTPMALSVGRRSDRQTMIIFNYADTEYFAIPLDLISLIEKIRGSDIKQVGPRQYYPFKTQTIPLLYLDSHLPVTPINRKQENYNLILPARVKFPIGLITNLEMYVVEVSERFDHKITHEKGVLGTFMHEDKLVMLLDLYALFEHDDPDHFDASTFGESLPARILLAEDSLFYRKLTDKYLRDTGREVVIVNDGKLALDRLRTDKDGFDLVISDIEMPNMDGFELIQAIRADSTLRDLPVLALTALADDRSREKGMALGFDEYVVKVDKENLLRSINKFAAQSNRSGRKTLLESQ